MVNNKTEAQAAYMQYLIDQALEEARKLENPAFDPQGRLIVDVTLNEAKRLEVAKKIDERFVDNGDVQTWLRDKLGFHPTPTTTISLDIKNDPALFETFKTSLREAGVAHLPTNYPNTTIIALQQEFHFHLSLTKRVYQALETTKNTPLFEFAEDALDEAHQSAMMRINKRIMTIYAHALKKATDAKGNINVSKLNKALDKARKTLLPEAHTFLMEEIVQKTGIIIPPESLNQAKKLAAHTSATPNDILHTDSTLHTVTHIQGSIHTAHDQKFGEHFGNRAISTLVYDDNNQLINNHPRVQIRAPALAVLEPDHAETDYVTDVETKLKHTKTDIMARSEANSSPTAFVYNLYTSLNPFFDGSNQQTLRAKRIIEGAHQCNRNQTENPMLCFVQNIAVNGFGDTLSNESSDPLIKEATLLSEMALLHTLGKLSTEILTHYKTYLNSNNRNQPYFSASEEGKKTINALRNLKNTYVPQPQDNLLTHVKKSLGHLIEKNAHCQHEYAVLIQTLSGFLEKASIAGCKSGNERTQMINGRILLLDALYNHPNLTEEHPSFKPVKQALATLSHGNDPLKHAKELNQAINDCYNTLSLQGAASLISLADQGASSKVQARKQRFNVSSNWAEASSLTNLSQTNASAMQAHKGLTKYMKAAWKGHPKSWRARLTSSPIALTASILFFPISIGVAMIAAAYDNRKRKKITQAKNRELQDAHFQHKEAAPQSRAHSGNVLPSGRHPLPTVKQKESDDPNNAPESKKPRPSSFHP